MGKGTSFKGSLCNACLFSSGATSCYKAGKLVFSRLQTSSRIPLSLDVFIKKESGSGTGGDRYFGEWANYPGVLSNLKFLNPLTDKPLEEGLAVLTQSTDGHGRNEREAGRMIERVNLLVVLFKGTDL